MAAVAVLWLPGRAISEVLSCLGGHRPKLVTSVGLSIAGVPLATLLLSLAQIRASRVLLTYLCILCGIVILLGWTARHLWPLQRKMRLAGLGQRTLSRDFLVRCLLLIVFAVTLVLRFLQIRDLVLPAWVDSLHHTLIVHVIREQGQIPDVLRAYTSIPFYYHFGFHTLAAAFGELANLPSHRSILILGQILNAIVVLSVYQLAVGLTARRGIGIAAATLTGFVSQMPAYYTSWGRYTLLTGMALLPIAMATAIESWRDTNQLRRGPQVALLSGGLVLAHYIAAAYYFCFLLALILTGIARGRRSRRWYRVFVPLGWSSLGLIIVAPWILKVFPYGSLFVQFQTMTSTTFFDRTVDFFSRLGYLWYLVNRPRSWAILSLALPAIVMSLFRCCSTRLLVAWVGILVVLSNEWLCQLWPFRADLSVICLFLPVNILAAKGLLALPRLVNTIIRSSAIPSVVVVLILVALSVWGFLDTISIVNPATVLATQADVEALAWIKENVPANARFLINVKPWHWNVYRGTDGGWWIPLLSHRATVLPPGVFYGLGDRRYILEIKEIADQVREINGCTPAFWEFIQEQRITHIYIGAKGGTLQPRWFDTCPGVWRVYMGYNVHIYEIRGRGCLFERQGAGKAVEYILVTG